MSVDTGGGGDYLAEMSDKDVARFKAHAEECLIQADRSVREADKEAWCRMADEWTKLARDAEQRRNAR